MNRRERESKSPLSVNHVFSRGLHRSILFSLLLATGTGQAQVTFTPAIDYDSDYRVKTASSPEAEELLRILWGEDWKEVQGGASYLRLADNSYIFLVDGSARILEGIYQVTVNPPRYEKIAGGSQEVLGASSGSSGELAILFRGVGYRRGYGFESISAATYGPAKLLNVSELLRIESDMNAGGCGPIPNPSESDQPERPNIAGDLNSAVVKDLNGDAMLDIIAAVREVDCTTGATIDRTRTFFYREGEYVEQSD